MSDVFRVSEVKYGKGGLFNSHKVQMQVINAMKKQGREMQKEFESTTQYWVHKPRFAYKMHYKGGDVYIEVGLTGTSLGRRYWNYVDKGTSFRYALFHPFYKPKTMYPGSLYSNTAGLYTMTIVNPDGSYAADSKIQGISRRRLRGIRARNWTRLVRERHAWSFAKDVTLAIQKGLKSK